MLPPPWTSAALESMTICEGLSKVTSTSSPWIVPPYAHDASLYEIDPLGVVVPRHEHDVVNVMRYAAENQVAVHPRGAGTDTGGGALGPGLVIDLSRHLRKIIAIGPEHIVVEPGVVFDVLNAQLAPLGRRLAPAPSDGDVMTLGGMIAVDTFGARSSRFGSIGDQVDRLRVVFAQGDVADLGFEPWPAFEAEPVDFKDLVVRKLHTLFRSCEGRLGRQTPAVIHNRAGYAFGRAVGEAGIHLGRLVAGSEGTLAVILQAVLRTVPTPAAQGVVLLPFVGLSDAAAIVPALITPEFAPCSCDLFDRRSLSLARDADLSFRGWIPEAAEAILTVEFEGDEPESVAAKARLLSDWAERKRVLVSSPVATTLRADCQRILGLRRLVEPLLMRFRGRARPVSFVDDVAVPPFQLASVLQRLQSLLQQQNLTWTLDACAGDGRLRIRPFLDLSDPGDRARLEPLASRFYDIVLEAGGTISSAQACGLARTQFLRKQYGELGPVFREIKDAFDPLGQLNPGKVIGDDPHLMLRSLKSWHAAAVPTEPEAELPPAAARGSGEFRRDGRLGRLLASTSPRKWRPSEQAVSSSVSPIHPALRWPDLSAGRDGFELPWLRNLPIARSRPCECARAFAHSASRRPRPGRRPTWSARSPTGEVDPRLWGADEFKAHADLCIHCKLCRTECPSGVDVSSLMLEAKAAYVEKHGLPPGDWIFSRIELWAQLGSRFPIADQFPALAALHALAAGPVAGRLAAPAAAPRAAHAVHAPRGPARLEQAPSAAAGPARRLFRRRLANYYDQELAEAVVSVLRHAEVNVYVPTRQRSSGMAALIVGDIDHARDQALVNLRRPGQRRPRRLHRRLLRADRRADASRRVHQAHRGPRRRARRRQHDGRRPVSARTRRTWPVPPSP